MHELPLVSGLLEQALEQMRALGATSLKSVEIRISGPGHLTPEAAAQHFEILARETPAANAEVRVSILPATLRCFDCLHVFESTLPAFEAVCPRCGGRPLPGGAAEICELGEVAVCA